VNPESLDIDVFMPLSNNRLIIDVRSPAEFNHAHIPRAINIPLFSNEERKIVGTTYKQASKEQAIKVALDLFGPKMRAMVEEVEKLMCGNQPLLKDDSMQFQNDNSVYVYCWRGGMRSGAVSWLLALYGFTVYILSGGYKSYRNHVLNTFARTFSFRVLGGFTGSGKTEVLKELKQKYNPVIDLEELANHKGSAFGNINMPPQPSQEMFENLLAEALNNLGNTKEIWVEDESQRIGNLNIPPLLWQTLRSSPIIFLDISFEERLNHILEEYGNYDEVQLAGGIERISSRLGGLETKHALRYLMEKNIHSCFRILLGYYDKHYLKGLHNREDLASLLTRIPCDKVESKNANLLSRNPQIV
jgi:tRNA 2-selenouridine synthase